MSDLNFDSFKARLIDEDLIFGDEDMSPLSLKMNQWRYAHLLGMARTAAHVSDKVTVDEKFDVGEMVAYLDDSLKLVESGLFSLEDIFDSLASTDPKFESAPAAASNEFEAESYLATLAKVVSHSSQSRPWRPGEPAAAVTKTSFPGTAPEIPLPPSLRK